MYAAITGDIIDSKNLELSMRDTLIGLLVRDFKQINTSLKLHFPFEFLRGDSFQGVASGTEDALRIALLLKCVFKKNFKQAFDTSKNTDTTQRKNWRTYNNLDVRIAIGIGPIEYLKDHLALSDGKALQYSGRELIRMKSKGQKIALITGNEEINREMEVELRLLDAILEKWTVMSAEVVFFLLQGYNETETANLLHISQSAINQRKRTAGWDAIEALLENFKKLIIKLNA